MAGDRQPPGEAAAAERRDPGNRAASGFGPLRDGSMIQWKVQERRS